MAQTTFLGIDKLATGQGSKDPTINADLDVLDGAIAGINSKNFAAATTAQTLTTAEARKMRHVFTNAGAAIDVKFPLLYSNNLFIVYNNSGFTLTIKTDAGGSTGVAVPNGLSQLLWINGNNVLPAGQLQNTTGTTIWARVFHNAAQSVANNTQVALAFNSERWDTDVIHDNTTNNSRLTCKSAGVYSIDACIQYANNTTGVRQCAIRLNGATYIVGVTVNASGGATTTLLTCETKYQLAVNDYVEVLAYQNSGGALNVDSTGNMTPEFAMARQGS